MSTSIDRILRTLDLRSRRRRDNGQANPAGDQLVPHRSDPNSKMKIQTDVRAGGGLMDIDVDLDLDLNLNLFAGGKNKVSGRGGKKG